MVDVDTAGTVLVFSPSGSITGVQHGRLNLSSVGQQQVRRATEIEFEETSQTWTIVPFRYTDDGLREVFDVPEDSKRYFSGFSQYNGARAAEVRWLNRCAHAGLDVHGEASMLEMRKIREEGGS